MLPLVCHKWRDLLSEASMWPVVDLAPQDFCLGSALGHGRKVGDWLQKCSPCMRELTVRVSAMNDGCHCSFREVYCCIRVHHVAT
jgi:hypothetical protein